MSKESMEMLLVIVGIKGAVDTCVTYDKLFYCMIEIFTNNNEVK